MNKLLCKQECAWKRDGDRCQSVVMRAKCYADSTEVTAQKILDSNNRLLSGHEINNITAAYNKAHKEYPDKAELAKIVAWAKQVQANALLLSMITRDNLFSSVDIVEGDIVVTEGCK